MKISDRQARALRWYAETYELKQTPSAHPTYYFTNRAGKEIKESILTIVNEWDQHRLARKRKRLS